MSRTGTWDEFEKRRGPDGAPPSTETEEFAILHARLFTSPDGREWLETMRAVKFGASTSGDISESALRHLNGQMQFLRDIDRLTARGLKALQRPKEVK